LSYQSPQMFSPIWSIDSAYGTVPASSSASYCPRKRQVCSTKDSRPAEKAAVLKDNDIVIPPSGVVSSREIEDDILAETQSDVSERENPSAISSNDRLVGKARSSRIILLRRRDTFGKIRKKRKNTLPHDVLRRTRSFKNLPKTVSASKNVFANTGANSVTKTRKKNRTRDKYLNILHALCHPSLKSPPEYKLCSAESGDEYMRCRQKQDEKMFFVETSDEEDSVPNNTDRSVDRHGVFPYGRHSSPPFR